MGDSSWESEMGELRRARWSGNKRTPPKWEQVEAVYLLFAAAEDLAAVLSLGLGRGSKAGRRE